MDKKESKVTNATPKLTDFPKNRENPFVNSLIVDVDPTRRRRMTAPSNKEVIQTISDRDGVITGQSAFIQYVEVDERQFAKLYLSNLAAFWDLSKPAIRVFTYIMSNIKPNQDTIDFILEDCLEYCQYKSRKPIFQGLADLLHKEIIARGRTQWQYFINPIITFNGDRVLFAKGLIRKKIKKQVTEEQLTLFGNFEEAGLDRLKKMNLQLEHKPDQPEEAEE